VVRGLLPTSLQASFASLRLNVESCKTTRLHRGFALVSPPTRSRAGEEVARLGA